MGLWSISAWCVVAGGGMSVAAKSQAAKRIISSARKVGLVLYCTQMWGDAFDLHYLTLTYQYAVWK